MKLQTIKVEGSVGKVLCHDITKIVKEDCKGAIFKKGHIIKPEDIPELLRVGKENIYILELEPGEVHEDEAGIRLGTAAAGSGVEWRGPSESRVNLFAGVDGLLKVNIPVLEAINELPDVVMATLPNNTVVKRGDMLAGTKVVPLVVPEWTVKEAESIGRKAGGVVQVVPFQIKDLGVIITGSEVFNDRIRDGFGPVITEKAAALGQRMLRLEYVPDECETIATLIKKQVQDGAGIVMVTGGMSVDPDDVTPKAICLSGAAVEKYGAPALPGAMFMLAYLDSVPILGVPACGMFFKTTIVDLLLPRLLAGERVNRKDIVALAHGGLCRSCAACHYPNCTFGKGTN